MRAEEREAGGARRERAIVLGNSTALLERALGAPAIEVVRVAVERHRATPDLVTLCAVRGVELLSLAGRRELTAALEAAAPLDLGLVCSFGMLLRSRHLALARRGFINFHYALLPDLRGRHPISAALRSGAQATGVTAHYIDAGIDTGPIIAQRRVAIGPFDTDRDVEARLTALLPDLADEALAAALAGEAGTPQVGGSHVAPVDYERDCRIDWAAGAVRIYDLIRSQTRFTGAFTEADGERLAFVEARICRVDAGVAAAPGTVLTQEDGGWLVVCAEPGLGLRVRAATAPAGDLTGARLA